MKAETTLTEVLTLMQAQANGEGGSLLVNGYANIFYVHDSEGVLPVVTAGWYAVGGGWSVVAPPRGVPVRDGTKWSRLLP